MEREIDLHGMTLNEAKKTLERFIATSPPNTTRIRVVHGHRHGDAIATMVRDPNVLRSTRIVQRKRTKNQGETWLILDA